MSNNPHELAAHNLKCSLDLSDGELMRPDYDSKVLWAPTGQFWTPDQERGLECVLPVRVTQILTKQAKRKITLVNLMAWSDDPNRLHVDDEHPLKDIHGRIQGAQAARDLNADVTVIHVGNPGVQSPTMLERCGVALGKNQVNRLTDEQIRDLRQGSFGAVSRDIATATLNALQEENVADHEVYFIAPSLAASIGAAGLVTVLLEKGVDVKGLAMLDGVGFTSAPAALRAMQFMSANGAAELYKRANHPLQQEVEVEGMPEYLRRVAESAQANWLYGRRGIPAGKIPADLMSQAGLFKETGVHILSYSAGNSEFGKTTIEASRQTMGKLSDMDVNAKHMELLDAGHGATTTTEWYYLALLALQRNTR